MNKRIKWGFMIFLILILSGCESKKYTIKIVNDNGEILSSVLVNEGDNIENVDDPIKDGYIFVGWLKDGVYYDTTTPIYADLTLTAKYTEVPEGRDSYIVTFNFGEYKKTKTVKIGEKIDKPNDPIKSGYKFLGWYYNDKVFNFDSEPNENIELVAKWKKISYIKVTFDLDGGDGTREVAMEKGHALSIPTEPTRMGYKFLGWYIGNEKYDFSMKVLEDITLTAKWEAIQYVRVSFDSDGGQEIKSQMIEMGTKITTLEIPVKEGYKFLYWVLGEEVFDKNMVIDKDIKLLAKYEKI